MSQNKPKFKPRFQSELTQSLLGSTYKKPAPKPRQMGGKYGHLYGTPEEWQAIRYKVLERDRYSCRRCGTSVRGKPRHIHHLTALSRGGRTVVSNLVTLCIPCHERQHKHMHSHR